MAKGGACQTKQDSQVNLTVLLAICCYRQSEKRKAQRGGLKMNCPGVGCRGLPVSFPPHFSRKIYNFVRILNEF